jgi:hypothetical protein
VRVFIPGGLGNEEGAMAIIKVGDFGDNTLFGGGGTFNELYGDSIESYGGATGGDDRLTGGATSTNYLFGDASEIRGANGAGGHDTLTGGANSTNYLYGDAESMVGLATGGNDTLIGGKGGTNTLYGDAKTTGGPVIGGDDRLVSAAQTTDHMWGDFGSGESLNITLGHDTFVFGPNNGTDFVYDFRQGFDIFEIRSTPVPGPAAANIPSQAADQIQATTNFPTTFSELDIELVDTNNDGNAESSVIQFGGVNSVTVYGVTGLTATDFDFVV